MGKFCISQAIHREIAKTKRNLTLLSLQPDTTHCVCVYTHSQVRIYTYTFIYIYKYIYTYTYTHSQIRSPQVRELHINIHYTQFISTHGILISPGSWGDHLC